MSEEIVTECPVCGYIDIDGLWPKCRSVDVNFDDSECPMVDYLSGLITKIPPDTVPR